MAGVDAAKRVQAGEATATHPEAARAWLDFMASEAMPEAKRRHGMEPA